MGGMTGKRKRKGFSMGALVWWGFASVSIAGSLSSYIVSGGDPARFALGACLAIIPALAAALGVELFILRPLRAIASGAESMRDDYDLRVRLRIKGSRECRDLARAINGFAARVQGTVYDLLNVTRRSVDVAKRLSSVADGMVGSSEAIGGRMVEISDSGNSLEEALLETDGSVTTVQSDTASIGKRIEEQASAVARTTSAIEEMAANIKAISRVLAERSGLAERIDAMRAETESRFAEFAEAIRAVSGSAGSIGDSIGVIKDISGRSNILAMNAAIEAAHAGDAGKGFGVVAEELRSLSEGTGENSKTISADLESIMAQFERASSLTESVNGLLATFASSVKSFLGGMAEIEGGLGEMSAGAREVLDSVATLGSVTQAVRDASNRISGVVSGLGTSYGELENLGKRNSEIALRSKEESAGIASVTRELSALGADNGAMLDLMLKELGEIRLTDLSLAKANDGQPLMFWSLENPTPPPRPERPEAYPETDRRHWHDYEYSGWGAVKADLPPSPMDGPEGKRVYYLLNTIDSENSGYSGAIRRGAAKISDMLGIELVMRFANISAEAQAVHVAEALAAPVHRSHQALPRGRHPRHRFPHERGSGSVSLHPLLHRPRRLGPDEGARPLLRRGRGRDGGLLRHPARARVRDGLRPQLRRHHRARRAGSRDALPRQGLRGLR
jgi:methyl-accepting chemotaxis protein